MRPRTMARTLAALGIAGLAAAMPAGAQDAGQQVGQAEAEVKPADAPPPANNFGASYYEAPVISTLSNKGEGWDLGKSIFGEESLWDFGGWIQQSTYTNSDGLFNSHPNGFRNQQSWLYLEKKIDTTNGFDIGGRVDAMYGTDAADTQSFGNEFGKYDFSGSFTRGISGFAIPQAYVELGYDKFSLKGGHFYTLLGYEVVPAPGNFFFSHAFTMYKSEPFTHTGAVLSYTGIDKLTLYGGWTAGWDTGFDQYRGGSNFIGGATYAPFDWLSATYLLTAGDLGWIGEGYSHSIVVNTKPCENLTWVFLSDLTAIGNDYTDDNGNRVRFDYDTYSVVNYLLYSIMDEVGVGTRFEWYRNQDVNYYEWTAGFNLKLLPNLLIRPEGRYQWGPGQTSGANNPAAIPVNVGIFGMDVILSF